MEGAEHELTEMIADCESQGSEPGLNQVGKGKIVKDIASVLYQAVFKRVK